MPSLPGNNRSAAAAAQRKPTLSPTKINTFLECAVKYRYIYIDKIGRFYLHANPGFSFGSTLHQVLQQFHQFGGEISGEEMAASLEQKWIAAGYESRQQEREHQEAAREIIAAYHSAHHERAALHSETVATEKTISCDMGRFKLTGRVDRIDRFPDGTLEIVDYKSGRLDVSVEEVASSLAMNCYQLIVQKLYPDSIIRGTIYCLRSGKYATYPLEGVALKEFESDLLSIGNQILDEDWDDRQPVEIDICPNCEFLSRCSTYWRQQRQMKALEDGPHSEDGL